MKAKEHKRSLAIRWRNGCHSVLNMGCKVCQPCTIVQCEMRGQGNVCELYEYSVRERGESESTVMWGSDNVHWPMNNLTAGMMLSVSVTYVLECKQCTRINECW